MGNHFGHFFHGREVRGILSGMTPLTNVDQHPEVVDASGRETKVAARVPAPRSAGEDTNPVHFTPVKAEKRPTRLGRYVLARMGELGMARQADLVRASGISESTVSRIILHPGYTPDRDTLVALAQALHLDPKALVLFVFDLDNEPAPVYTPHPRAAQIDRLLGPDTQLSEEKQEHLDGMLELLIEPLLRPTRRRTG